MSVPNLDPQTRADVVSQLAKGFPVDDVARRNHLAPVVVNSLRLEFGPGMGELEKSAERLRIPTTDETEIKLTNAATYPALVADVTRARALIGSISARVEQAEMQQFLRGIVSTKVKELAEAERELAKAGFRTDDATRAESAEIRKWATVNGVKCPDRGRIPNAVRTAWEAAQDGAIA